MGSVAEITTAEAAEPGWPLPFLFYESRAKGVFRAPAIEAITASDKLASVRFRMAALDRYAYCCDQSLSKRNTSFVGGSGA